MRFCCSLFYDNLLFTGMHYYHKSLIQSVKLSQVEKLRKPLKCHHCDKTFVQNDDLRVHKRLHTCKKHSSATNVTRLFVQNDDLRVHESLHTCEKPFKCHFYDEKFDQKDKLREHAKIHTGKKTPRTQGSGWVWLDL